MILLDSFLTKDKDHYLTRRINIFILIFICIPNLTRRSRLTLQKLQKKFNKKNLNNLIK